MGRIDELLESAQAKALSEALAKVRSSKAVR